MRRLLLGATLILLSACDFKLKPSFPASRIAEDLKEMCRKDYKMTVETRRQGDSLQAFFWTVGLLKSGEGDLSPDAAEGLQRVLLCATRVMLSTDATLQFVDVKMTDVVNGDSLKVWRFVPDLQDSMHNRMGEEEYFNRMVFDIEQGTGKMPETRPVAWDEPISLPVFLAKQIVQRARRESLVGLQAHEDLSDPATLRVVIDNWPTVQGALEKQKTNVTDVVGKTAKTVLQTYRFKGFRGIALEDNHGVSLGWLAL